MMNDIDIKAFVFVGRASLDSGPGTTRWGRLRRPLNRGDKTRIIVLPNGEETRFSLEDVKEIRQCALGTLYRITA